MKRNLMRWVLAVACCAASNLFGANVLGTGAFQPWNASLLGSAVSPVYGGPYWNQFSGDGPAGNIGWCLVGGGDCSIGAAPGALPYYGSGANAVADMALAGNGTPIVVSLLGAFTNQNGANNAGVDSFGWYEIHPDGTIGTLTPLWSATSPIGSTATFTPTTTFGFYLENTQGGGQAQYFWFMTSSADYGTGPGATGAASPDTSQHFALFNGADSLYLGVEDTNLGDQDFNDMIVKITSVPEPTTFEFAFATGGLALTIARVKRYAKSRSL